MRKPKEYYQELLDGFAASGKNESVISPHYIR